MTLVDAVVPQRFDAQVPSHLCSVCFEALLQLEQLDVLLLIGDSWQHHLRSFRAHDGHHRLRSVDKCCWRLTCCSTTFFISIVDWSFLDLLLCDHLWMRIELSLCGGLALNQLLFFQLMVLVSLDLFLSVVLLHILFDFMLDILAESSTICDFLTHVVADTKFSLLLSQAVFIEFVHIFQSLLCLGDLTLCFDHQFFEFSVLAESYFLTVLDLNQANLWQLVDFGLSFGYCLELLIKIFVLHIEFFVPRYLIIIFANHESLGQRFFALLLRILTDSNDLDGQSRRGLLLNLLVVYCSSFIGNIDAITHRFRRILSYFLSLLIFNLFLRFLLFFFNVFLLLLRNLTFQLSAFLLEDQELLQVLEGLELLLRICMVLGCLVEECGGKVLSIFCFHGLCRILLELLPCLVELDLDHGFRLVLVLCLGNDLQSLRD